MNFTNYSNLMEAFEKGGATSPPTPKTDNSNLIVGIGATAFLIIIAYQLFIIPKVKAKLLAEQQLANYIKPAKEKVTAAESKEQPPEIKDQDKIKNEVVNSSLPPEAKSSEQSK